MEKNTLEDAFLSIGYEEGNFIIYKFKIKRKILNPQRRRRIEIISHLANDR